VLLLPTAHPFLQPELGEFIDPMFPHPINAFSRLVSKIAAIEVSAQKQDEANLRAIGDTQLTHFGGLFLAALVHVGEVACRFRLDEQGQFAGSGPFGMTTVSIGMLIVGAGPSRLTGTFRRKPNVPGGIASNLVFGGRAL